MNHPSLILEMMTLIKMISQPTDSQIDKSNKMAELRRRGGGGGGGGEKRESRILCLCVCVCESAC